YDAHFDRLADYIRWRCAGIADLAEDATQETWLTAVRRMSHFDPRAGSFHAWLCGIAANVIRNALRSRRRAEPVKSLVTTVADPPARDDADRKHVAAALAELPEHYEAVLRAKYLERQTVEEIAAARGETAKAVESLLTRAREAFRAAYSD